MSALMPQTEPVERKQSFQDEWAVRYGILMGGTKVARLDGIGEFWVGHTEIPRRQLVGFTHQQVRGRNEAQDSAALDEPGGGLLAASPLESRKLIDKSPALCMREAFQMIGAKGFINSQALMGDADNADRIFSVVLPDHVSALPLMDVINFLQSSDYVDRAFMDGGLRSRAQQFREECLQGAFVARDYMTTYTSAIGDEIASDKKTGKKTVDSVDIEYFWELKKTLPKDKPLEATTMLGREIAQALAANSGGSTEALVAQMAEQNRLKMEELELRRLELNKELVEAKRGPGRPPKTDKGD